jgi:hypothetical protein
VRHSYVIFGALAALLTIAQTALAQDAFGPIRVAANRSKYAGACPVEVIFTGNINLNTPHPRGFTFNYQWVRSDGAKGRVNVVRPSPGQHMLVVIGEFRQYSPAAGLSGDPDILPVSA